MPESVEHEIRTLQTIFWSDRDPDGLAFAPLADALRRKGDTREAMVVLADGIARHPDYATGHVVATRLYMDQGMDSEAESSARRVLELDPENLVALSALVSLLTARGDLGEAARYKTTLLATDPESEEARSVAEVEVEAGGLDGREAAAPEAAAPGDTEVEDEDVLEPAEEEAGLGEDASEEAASEEVAAPQPAGAGPGGSPPSSSDVPTTETPLQVVAEQAGSEPPEIDELVPEAMYQDLDTGSLLDGVTVQPSDGTEGEAEDDVMDAPERSSPDADEEMTPKETDLLFGLELELEDLDALAVDASPESLGADMELASDPLDLASLAPDEPPGEAAMDVGDLAPDETEKAPAVMDVAHLAPEEAEANAAMDVGDLAPDEGEAPAVVDVADLAPEAEEAPEVVDVADLAPEEAEAPAAVDVADLAPEEAEAQAVVDVADLAPEEAEAPAVVDVASSIPDEDVVRDAEPAPRAREEDLMDVADLAPEGRDEEPGHVTARTEEDEDASSEPVYTRTLADLYSRQGFHDKALQILRHIQEREPEAADLEERIEAMEAKMAEATGEPAPGAAPTEPSGAAPSEPPGAPPPEPPSVSAPEGRAGHSEEDMERRARELAERAHHDGDDLDTPFAWSESGEEVAEEEEDGDEDIASYLSGLLAWERQAKS